MQTSKIDRRVNRTRRLLRESLMSLVVERGYDTVTIEDITNRAELGRTTFYLHYKDKEELLLESIDMIADEVTEKIAREVSSREETGIDFNHPNRFRPILVVFQHAAENRMLYQIILHGEGSPAAATRIRKIIYDAARMFFSVQVNQNLKVRLTEEQLALIAGYYSSSLLGYITWWLETESKYTPEQMGEYFRIFFFKGVRGFVQEGSA